MKKLTFMFIMVISTMMIQPTFAGSTAAQQIADTICTSLKECHGESFQYSQCYVSALLTDQLAREFGAADTDGELRFGATAKKVSDGELSVNMMKLNFCLTYLENLSCNDYEGAWDELSPSNFGNLENVFNDGVPVSCSGVFY